MSKRDRWSIGWGLVTIGIFALLLAVDVDRHQTARVRTILPPGRCRSIEHSGGKSCIPIQPQRIVALDPSSLESLLAVGIAPVGMVSVDLNQSHLLARTAGITNVGTNGEPNLEQILTLKPDLILGADYHLAIYPQLSRIAPTVLTKFTHSGDWQNFFRSVAAAIGTSPQAERVMAEYYQRLRIFQQRMGDRLANQVSIVYIYPDTISVYTKVGFNGTIVRDAGLARPPAQNLDLAATLQRGNFSPIQYQISPEIFDLADGDWIFVIVNPQDRRAGKTRERLLAHPLWSKLAAVRQGRVSEVGEYWIGSGPIAANLAIDDLYKSLMP